MTRASDLPRARQHLVARSHFADQGDHLGQFATTVFAITTLGTDEGDGDGIHDGSHPGRECPGKCRSVRFRRRIVSYVKTLIKLRTSAPALSIYDIDCLRGRNYVQCVQRTDLSLVDHYACLEIVRMGDDSRGSAKKDLGSHSAASKC